MNWKWKLMLLLLTAVPAFTGYPVNRFDPLVVAGITRAWAVYLGLANITVLAVCGGMRYARILTATALVTLPVIASGGCLSFLVSLFADDMWSAQVQYSAHYLRLCVTMLTVVPLALGLVSVVPLQSFEQTLLLERSGVSMFRKILLMALRVFNHIVYYVIPTILEVVREERQFLAAGEDAGLSRQGALIIRRMTHVAGEGICAAIQYIPLWAVEISRLPGVKEDQNRESAE